MSQLKDLLEKSKRQMKDVKATIHVVFTVQEEVGLKGGREKWHPLPAQSWRSRANRCIYHPPDA